MNTERSAKPSRLHRSFCLLPAPSVLAASRLASSDPKTSAPAAQLAPSTSQHTAIGQLPTVDIDAVLRHTKTLSADEFEGRAPGGKGEVLTVNYLVDQFKKIGLKPGNTDGTYTQKVPLVGITGAEARPLTIAKGAEEADAEMEGRGRRLDEARRGRREHRQQRARVCRLRRRGAGVRLERLQGRGRQGQDDRRASSTTRRCPTRRIRRSSIRRRSTARR